MRRFPYLRGRGGDSGGAMVRNNCECGLGRRGREDKGAKECASGYNIQSDTGDVLVCHPDGQWR